MTSFLSWLIKSLTPKKFLSGQEYEVNMGLFDIESRTGKLMLAWRKSYSSQVGEHFSIRTPFEQISTLLSHRKKSLTEHALEKLSQEQSQEHYRFFAEFYQKVRYQLSFHSTEPGPHQPFETSKKYFESLDLTSNKMMLKDMMIKNSNGYDNSNISNVTNTSADTTSSLNILDDLQSAMSYVNNEDHGSIMPNHFKKIIDIFQDSTSSTIDRFWVSSGIDPNCFKNLSQVDIDYNKIDTCYGAIDGRAIINYSEIQNSNTFSNYIDNVVCIIKKTNNIMDVRNSIHAIPTDMKDILINTKHHWTNLINDTIVCGQKMFQKLNLISSTFDVKTQHMALIDHLKSTSDILDLNSQIELIFELANRVNTTLWTVLPAGLQSAPAISPDIMLMASIIIPVKIVTSSVTEIIASTTQINFLPITLANIVQDIPIKNVITNLDRILAFSFGPFTSLEPIYTTSVQLQYTLKDAPSIGIVIPDSKTLLNLKGVIKKYTYSDIFLSNPQFTELMYKNLFIPGVDSTLAGTFQSRLLALCQLGLISEFITPLELLEKINSPEVIEQFNNYMSKIGLDGETFKNITEVKNILRIKKFSVEPVKHIFNLVQGRYPMTYAEDLLYFTHLSIADPYGLESICELMGNSHFHAFMNQVGCEAHNYKDLSLYAKDMVVTLANKAENHRILASVTSNSVERQYHLNCYLEMTYQIMLFDMKYNLNMFYVK